MAPRGMSLLYLASAALRSSKCCAWSCLFKLVSVLSRSRSCVNVGILPAANAFKRATRSALQPLMLTLTALHLALSSATFKQSRSSTVSLVSLICACFEDDSPFLWLQGCVKVASRSSPRSPSMLANLRPLHIFSSPCTSHVMTASCDTKPTRILSAAMSGVACRKKSGLHVQLTST